MHLAYNKLSFSQVYKLYTALQRYYNGHYSPDRDGKPSLSATATEDTDMELTDTDDTVEGKMEKEELDSAPLPDSELVY